jgi:hypothetical protein
VEECNICKSAGFTNQLIGFEKTGEFPNQMMGFLKAMGMHMQYHEADSEGKPVDCCCKRLFEECFK